jgi:hypothetical protein
VILVKVGELVVHENIALEILLEFELNATFAGIGIGLRRILPDVLGTGQIRVNIVVAVDLPAVGVIDPMFGNLERQYWTTLNIFRHFLWWLTPFEKCKSTIPTGMKAIPMMKNVGKTVPAVSTGCQLGNLEKFNKSIFFSWKIKN